MKRPYLTVDKIGELELIDVFAEYDYPLLFVCHDQLNSLYLIIETKHDAHTTEWIASRITENQYHDLVGERCSFESVFRENSSSFIFLLTDHRVGTPIDCSIIDSLPVISSFTGDTMVSELGYNPASFQTDGGTIIEIEAFPNQAIHSVPISMNRDVCDSIEKTVRCKYGNDYVLECEPPRAASYGFRFSVKSPSAQTFSSNNAEISKAIVKSISANDDEIKAETIETIESIAKLYKTFKKYKTDFIVNAVQRNNKCFYSKEISSERISLIEKSISSFIKEEKAKQAELVEKSVRIISGALIAYGVRKRSFEIIDNNGEVYSGKFAESFNAVNHVVGLNSSYLAKISIDSNGKKELLELIYHPDGNQIESKEKSGILNG